MTVFAWSIVSPILRIKSKLSNWYRFTR
jgi:hypothetical protein